MTPYPAKDFGSHFNHPLIYTRSYQKLVFLTNKDPRGETMSNPSDIISGHTIAFDQGIAIECGINAAIIYNHIIFWLKVNKDKPDSNKEGKVWMYQTQDKMADFFQFFGVKETKNAIKILIDAGLLVKKNFNKNHFDQTNWYSLSDECYQKVFTKVPKRTIDESPREQSDGVDPGLSDGVNPGPCNNKEKDKEEDKEIAGLAASENQETILYQGRNAKPKSITKSEIFSSLGSSGFEATVISAAIKKFSERKGSVGDPIKLIALICEDIKKSSKKPVATAEPIYKELKNPTKLKLR